jgi:1-deoxy-D-xylulose-5-phosphate reductoisomerase
LTASGGAFRDFTPDALANVTPEQALNHPTWSMGARITVDSATLMNKAFEVIEAHWLFGIPWDNIDVVIHPQSIIHSMVEFVDGSVKAQLSQPDMQLPIQYALMYPERVANSNVAKFSPTITGSLTFEPMDPKRYPCFNLAIDVAKKGGTWPAVLCGADELAVELFLKGKIGFSDITDVISSVLDDHMPLTAPSLEEIISAASWAKDRAYKMVEG